MRPTVVRLGWCLIGALVLCIGACRTTGPDTPQTATEIYLDAGRYRDAAREAEQDIRVKPDDVALRKLAARAHAGAGNPERAIEHLEIAFDLAPADAETSVLLGEIEQKRGNLPDAYVAFRRAAQLDPDDIRAWSGLALSAEALGFEEEAADAYARWARLEQELGLSP
jgi:tetratricopeptide (TPR) repeat protein